MLIQILSDARGNGARRAATGLFLKTKYPASAAAADPSATPSLTSFMVSGLARNAKAPMNKLIVKPMPQ
jgi:hypothetical protein